MATQERKPLDVWLRWDGDDIDEDGEDRLADYEANTYAEEDGTFTVEWYLNAVGLVTEVSFKTYEDAAAWLEGAGYIDFSSGE